MAQKSKKHYILFYFIVLMLIPSKAYPIYFKNIGVKDGLAQLSVMSICQDKLGRMWFGTLEGLSVYDGDKVVSWKSGDSSSLYPIKENQVFAIVENAANDIFIRADSSIVKYDFSQNVFSYIQKGGTSALSSINGSIYIAKKDSIYIWNEKNNVFDFLLKTSLGGVITKIHIDSKERIWVGSTEGMYVYNENSGFECVIKGKYIYTIFESSSNDIWVGTRMQGMFKIDTNDRITEYLHDPNNKNSISSNQVRDFVEDKDGTLWIGTFTGLNKLDLKTNVFSVYTRDNLPGSLVHSSVFALMHDRQGTIWIGTYYGGVSYFNTERSLFTYYFDNPSRDDCLGYPFVGDMVEDREHNIWICTEGGGLHFMDRKTRKFKQFVSDVSENSPINNNLQCITYDSLHNTLYMGSYIGGIISYDISKKKFRNYIKEVSHKENLRPTIVTQVEMYKNRLILLSQAGLLQMDLATGNLTPLSESSKHFRGFNFKIDSNENLWLTSVNGIVKISLTNTSDIKEYISQELLMDKSNIQLQCIFESKEGNIYFGTHGYGVLEYNSTMDTFSQYTVENNKLLSNYCYAISQSNEGYLTIIGDKGISFFDPKEKLVKHAAIGNNMPVSAFNDGNGLLVCSDGEIFVGAADGLVSFYENGLKLENENHFLYFSELFINNKKVQPSDGSKILDQIIALTHTLYLSHKQNNLTFTFANSNYVNGFNLPLYEYMLEGFDEEWIYTSSPRLVYTNLNPGKYTLKVREKNVLEPGYYDEIQEKIVIYPPFYNTFLAWLFYIFVAYVLILLFVCFRQRQLKLKTLLLFERREKEYIKELNQSKQNFFTNVSHEFRTPLTLIITQIEILMQSNDITKNMHDKIAKIYNNTFHLRSLVNELLYFQKSEQQHIGLKVRECDLIPFLRKIYQSFEEQAQVKKIRYNFTTNIGQSICYFDPEQLQKVFLNLLSNAFKFTPQNGLVEINIEEIKNKEIVIKIIDSGIGIDKKDIERIFEQFYQVTIDITKEASQTFSTGIGLTLSENIVKQHHGTIAVESKTNYGSIFIVKLQKGSEHFESDATVKMVGKKEPFAENQHFEDCDFTDKLSNDLNLPICETNVGAFTILIVEDNEELLQLLISIFTPMYNVISSTNGRDGLQKAINVKPDIILSDIMMPQMTGAEMCLKLKNNILTSHIPIVLLTAKSSPEHNIDGLQKGADDYVTKPFNTKVLLARCNNLIRNRLLLQMAFKKEADFNIQLLANNELDQMFLTKAEQIIETNIDHPEFDVEMLIQEMAMGRSTMFVKFKTLTGMTPNNFILNYKLKRSAYLLKNKSELQIKDIADMLGFSSSRYFSKCFKQQFAISPTEYRNLEKKAP